MTDGWTDWLKCSIINRVDISQALIRKKIPESSADEVPGKIVWNWSYGKNSRRVDEE